MLFVFCIISGAFGSLVIWDTVLKSLYGIDEREVIERMPERQIARNPTAHRPRTAEPPIM